MFGNLQEMKILSASQLQQADAFTIENEPVTSVDLMERAAQLLYVNFKNTFPASFQNLQSKQAYAIVLCGSGNNGGDGLVLARLMAEDGIEVVVCHFSLGKKSADFEVNEQRLNAIGIQLHEITGVKSMPEITPNSIVFDAIFGSGLNRPIEGQLVNVVQWINKQAAALKIAIDIPSGLFADDNSSNHGEILRANFTFTFQVPKYSFMLPDWANCVGDFKVIDIHLHPLFLAQVPTSNYFITPQILQVFLKSRAKFSHKGTFGHCLVIAGSEGKLGAAILASSAALRSGTGLVTLASTKKGVELAVVHQPEIMGLVNTDKEESIAYINDYSAYSSIAIGPGLGLNERTEALVKHAIQSGKASVIDADALNCIAANKTWLHFLAPNSILTPHPKEFDRLFGDSKTSELRLQVARRKAVELKVVIVLKGAHTAICCPDGLVFFNSTGNSGMATAGSGDVLTGLIGGLMAQGYSAKQAAILGVYLQGLAGDIGAELSSTEALLATDIIENIGKAFTTLRANFLA